MLTGHDLALACAEAADQLKAEDIRIFDLRGISTLTDFHGGLFRQLASPLEGDRPRSRRKREGKRI